MFNHFSRYLKLIRAVPLHVMAQDLGIDAGLLSKYENGNRIPDIDLVIVLAHYHQVDARELCVFWMRERIKRSFIGYEHLVEDALPDAEKDVKYFLKYHKVKLERKFSFKLILKNAIVYDHSQAVTLRHFQFRRHGVTNH
jgi:transcriptional regulator with XRE-family HTH domain